MHVRPSDIRSLEGVAARVPGTAIVQGSVFVHGDESLVSTRRKVLKEKKPPNFVFVVIDSLSTVQSQALGVALECN
jgi:hypothetical protein